MAISTLVIGLGGTGVYVLRYLKQMYEQLPDDQRVPARFLAFDFDRSATMTTDSFRLGKLSEQEFFYLQPGPIQDLLRNIDRRAGQKALWSSILEWFPDRDRVTVPISEVEANGAGQYRPLGRVGFFLNDERLDNAVAHNLESLPLEVDGNQPAKNRRVILVSSLAGGTGAGMLVDMAYLARRQTLTPRVWAYLMLPEVFRDVDHGGRTYQNAYAALRELAHLRDQQIRFDANYPDLPPLHVEVGGEAPFSRLFLFGRASSSSNGSISPLQAAYNKVAAAILAQLQRTIQEKSLAIASNTLSSQGDNTRRRARTHGFSTAGSYSIELNSAEVTPEAILKELGQVLEREEVRAALFADSVDEGLHRALDSLGSVASAGSATPLLHEPPAAGTSASAGAPGGSGGAEASAAKAGATVDPPQEQMADKVLRQWRQGIHDGARRSKEIVLRDLKEVVEKTRAMAGSGDSKDLQEALAETEKLHGLLFRPFSKENYPSALEQLAEFTNFGALDEDTRREINTLLDTFEATIDNLGHFKKGAYLKALNEINRDAWIRFPEETSLQIAELEKHWQFCAPPEAPTPPWWRRWFGGAPPAQDLDNVVVPRCLLLEEALQGEVVAKNIEAILRVRAYAELSRQLKLRTDRLKEEVSDLARPIAGVAQYESVAGRVASIPPLARHQLQDILRSLLPMYLQDPAVRALAGKDVGERSEFLLRWVKLKLEENPRLRTVRYFIGSDRLAGDGQDNAAYSQTIVRRLVEAQQEIFIRRTPSPQRKAFGLLLVPRGIAWPGGAPALREFLEANAAQILDCRSEVIEYEGSRIWIYFEDLFNPPEHIRLLDDYYQTYAREAYKELFHIDRRFLDNPDFREIFVLSGTFVARCGNPDCRANIADVPATTHVCPSCSGWIRSRCGNAGCNQTELHLLPDRRGFDTACPGCGQFNHAAWWRCYKHGKREVLVSTDKLRCPTCIERHHADPSTYPLSAISQRPDLADNLKCPSCEDLEEENHQHPVFAIPADLVPFYRDGVNGHDRARFIGLSRRHSLPDGFRCPSCRTALIPIDHRAMGRRRDDHAAIPFS